MATDNQKHVLAANEKFASTYDKGHLKSPPSKKYAIVTCMDARLDPAAAFGIDIGDAHVIRNAGGSAQDALRSIVISQHLLGTTEILLIKHTKCGMLGLKNGDALAAVEQHSGPGVLGSSYDFQPFADLKESVIKDVEDLKGNKALVKGATVSGWVYDVVTGKLEQVA